VTPREREREEEKERNGKSEGEKKSDKITTIPQRVRAG